MSFIYTGSSRAPAATEDDPDRSSHDDSLNQIQIDLDDADDDEGTVGQAAGSGAANESRAETDSTRHAVKKRRGGKAEYWVSYEEYTAPDNSRRARCIHCGRTYACDSNKVGTKNLRKHYGACKENQKNKENGMQSQIVFDKDANVMKMKNWKYESDAVRASIVEMVIRDEQPFNCVEKYGFQNALSVSCPQFKMPSRTTIQRDCFQLYVKEREKVKVLLKNSCQSVCVTTDTWTDIDMVNYMCVTAHFIDDDWKLQKKLINFIRISSHRGQDIARALEDCLNYWDLDKKLLTVTVDNASANDVACTYISEMAKVKGCIGEGKYMQMRCIAHILNLIVQDGIKQCGKHVDKLRAVVKYIRGSPARLFAFKQCAERCKVDFNGSLRLDVCTGWNSTYDMLASAIPFKTVFSRMELPRCDESDFGPLSSTDWSRIEVLASFLKAFYDLTKRISGSLYVTSNFTIFHIAEVVKVLDRLSVNEDQTLKNMASEMKKKCDKYWGSFYKLNPLVFVPNIVDPFYKMRGVSIVIRWVELKK